MNKTLVWLCLPLIVFLWAGPLAAAEVKTAQAGAMAPQAAVLDIRTRDVDPQTALFLSDILRTELFKLQVFRIVERSLINRVVEENKLQKAGFVDDNDLMKVGRILAVEKLVVMTLGNMNRNIAINIRVINVETATVDFSENIFIGSRESIIDGIKDTAKKIEVFYVLRSEQVEPGNKKELMKRKWALLGASGTQLETLTTMQNEPDQYLDIRQYDITFTIDDYIRTVRNGWNPEVIKKFLQKSIPYKTVMRSLTLGITDPVQYELTFAKAGYSYEDYLLAFENHITTVHDYQNFKNGYRQDRLVLGAGGAADSFPIANANFGFLAAQVGWEHFWSQYQRDLLKYSMEMGFHLLNGVVPSPYFQLNGYIGAPPFYGKLGAGVLIEPILGGHIGAYVRVGMEVLEFMEFNVIIVPLGTQPGVSYTDLKTRQGEPGYVPINFPYYGAFLTVKI